VEIAKKEMGKSLYAAVLAVGFFAGVTKLIKDKNIQKSVIDNAPKGTEVENLKAVRIGYALAKAALKAKDSRVHLTLKEIDTKKI
jgi:Pyruvate/2-oxoacid:ferredoxin oxidoreductase gamma subunit